MNLKSTKILSVLFGIILLAAPSLCAFAQDSNSPKAKQNDSSVIRSRSHYLRTEHIRIRYLEWNRAGNSTIILLHGMNDDAKSWSVVAPLLARNYRVIALDRRGAGLTDKPATGYDFHTLAGDVLSFVSKLNLRRVHLVGHSAGAGVALTAAAIKPEQIDSVVLVDGGFWPKRAESSNTSSVVNCNAKTVDCKRISALMRGSMDYDAEPLYSRVTSPTLLIMGIPAKSEADQFASELREAQSHVETVANEKLQNAKMIVIKETSHWIQRDQPNELASAIESFLKQSASNKSQDTRGR